ncbi:MAG TPA: hypothetical protein VMG82_36000 [Candidatus Sulfotelmatobacter sp.]|nr:hypothetical protein [Candidatus Sulfotelmatobacter sp.]
MIAAVLIVSKSFSLPPIIPNNSSAASLGASGNAGAIITGSSSLPTPFTGRSAGRVRTSGARPTLAIGNNTARTTLSKWNVIASGSNAVTKSAAC